MLSIHYVSVMMWIVDIDWQQYQKCDWTMNIGADSHGKERYQPNSHDTGDKHDMASSDIGEVLSYWLFGAVYWYLGRREYFGGSTSLLFKLSHLR